MSMFSRSDKPSGKQDTGQDKETTAPETPVSPAQEQRPASTAYRKSTPSVISAALTVTGNLESAGEIQIDGKVEGDVRGQMVKVGEGASIKGSVFGESVELAGTVDGKIEAKMVVITRTGHMTGDIVHESLQIEQGAHVEGHCRPHYGKNEAVALQAKRGAQSSQHESGAERRIGSAGGGASMAAS